MSKRDEYLSRMENELALWSARFEAMKTKAGKDATAEIAHVLERWHEAKEIAAAKLVELRATVDDGWDAVKAELEKAWHAIETVLNEGEPHSRIITKEELVALTPEQQDGILEAMVMAVVADGKVGKDEVARFDVELGRVPWTQPKEEILKKALAARARVAALANDEEKQAMLEGIAARLPRGSICEKTVGMMAMVMASDGSADPREVNTLNGFAVAFGITKDQMAAISASLRGA